MSHNSAVTDDGACLDVTMYGFQGGCFQKAFVDIRVCNPCTQSNHWSPLTSVYGRHEQRVREVEHYTMYFDPLVISATGGMGRAVTTFFEETCLYDQ